MAEKNILRQIKSKGVLLSDGAWGTQLFNKGLEPGECPELWNLNFRNKVLEIAQSYVNAGADIIGTNSFGGNSIKLEMYGQAEKAARINVEAARISREAAGPEKFVFGSVGPTGKILMMGDVTEKQVYDSFREQCISLSTGGVDAILIETMTALDEALLAVQAAKENTRLSVICTFSFDKTIDNKYRTMMGVSPTEMATTLINAGADIIGTNCGNGFDGMVDICREIRAVHSDIPLLVQANAGMPRLIDGNNVFPESPKDMAEKIPTLIDMGVNIIGGCCGTNPEHIAEFEKIIHK